MSEEREGLISGKEKRPNIFQRLAYTISKKIDQWKYNRIKAKSEKERQERINQSIKFYKQAEKEYVQKADHGDEALHKLNPSINPEYAEKRGKAIMDIALKRSQDEFDKRMAKADHKADKKIQKKLRKMERML